MYTLLFPCADLEGDDEDHGHYGRHRPQVLVRAHATGGRLKAEAGGEGATAEPRNHTRWPDSAVGASHCQQDKVISSFIAYFTYSGLFGRWEHRPSTTVLHSCRFYRFNDRFSNSALIYLICILSLSVSLSGVFHPYSSSFNGIFLEDKESMVLGLSFTA